MQIAGVVEWAKSRPAAETCLDLASDFAHAAKPEIGRVGIAPISDAGPQDRAGAMPALPTRYLKISKVSGLRRKLLHALKRTGQFEMATICGISARRMM